ncbi:MAG: STAS domain-containing protein [Acidimicrobiia bacterium]
MAHQPDTQGPTAVGLSLRRRDGHDRVLEVIGEIDVATSPVLRSELADLLADSPNSVTLDFAQVSFIDSSGLGVLVGALKRLRETSPGAALHVAHTHGAVRNVFDIMGLDELFDLS